MTDYGKLIKEAREQAGLTQEELGKEIGVTGVTIMRYEKGQRNPSSDVIGEIAKVLGADFAVSVIKEVSQSVTEAVESKQREDEETRAKRREWMAAALKASSEKVGRKITQQEFLDMGFFRFDTEIYVRLNEVIKRLNNEGRKVALERIEELTLIDKYTLPNVEKYLQPPATEQPTGHKQDKGIENTQKQEKPPESH